MTLTIVVQNVKVGGFPDNEGEPHRWPQLRERITAAGPVDLLVLCEVAGWDRKGHEVWWRACADLDLDPVPLTPARSGNGTALLYRRETVGRPVRWNPDFTGELLHGLATTSFDVGLPAPLTVAPVHFTPFSADQALIEAGVAASRAYKYGPFVVTGVPAGSSDCPVWTVSACQQVMAWGTPLTRWREIPGVTSRFCELLA